MNIDFDRIEKIYGSSIINSIYLLKDDVIDNIKYFISLGFEDTEDIFERQVLIFICPKEEFRVKINNGKEFKYTSRITRLAIAILDELS